MPRTFTARWVSVMAQTIKLMLSQVEHIAGGHDFAEWTI
jgi:hypothetical protein